MDYMLKRSCSLKQKSQVFRRGRLVLASWIWLPLRDSTRPARSETLLWHKAGALDTKKPHRVMRLSLKWLPLRDSNLRHTD